MIVLLTFTSFADSRTCKTVMYNQHIENTFIKENNPQTISSQKDLLDSICIPIVVHNVYNLPEQKIDLNTVRAQIEIINKDFNANNNDLSEVDPAFKSLTASTGFHFFLVDKDLNGNNFSGINYKQTLIDTFKIDQKNQTQETFNVKHKLNGVKAWNPNKYINIWVCNLQAGISGYAAYPESTEADDGIVIHYQNFGFEGSAVKPPFHLGRTLTHELGHYFGLKHLYGESLGNCVEDDGLADTPLTNKSYTGCPQAGENLNRCNDPYSKQDMVQNFMNQTNDACIMMFTNDQKTRMHYYLAEHRKELIRKNCFLNEYEGIDLSLEIDAKPILNCGLSPILPIRICNAGTVNVYSFNLYTNSTLVEEKNVQLTPSECIDYSVALMDMENQKEVIAWVSIVNGLEQEHNLQNNADTVSLVSISKANFPFEENFDEKPTWLEHTTQFDNTSWLYLNETVSEESGISNNGCYSLNNNEDHTISQIHLLHLPYFNLSDIASSNKNENLNFCIEFDYAYAQSTENNAANGMMLEYAIACSPDNYMVLWEKWGLELETSELTNNESFLPDSDDWHSAQQSFSVFSDENNLHFRIKFIANGINQIFVDNFSVNICESIPLNIQNYLIENTFGVFPNPSDGEFNLYSSNLKNRTINVEVFNVSGQNVEIFTFQKQHLLNLSTFPNGCYFIKMQYEGHILSKKLILSK